MRKRRRHFLYALRHAPYRILWGTVAAMMILPLACTFLYSFFPQTEITAYLDTRMNYNPTVFMDVLFSPAEFSLRQYYAILIEDLKVLNLFCNSCLYTVAILLGQVCVVPLTAYALSKFEFRGRNALFFAVLVLMVLPFQVTMAPNVITLRAMGLLGTVWAIILPMWFSPFYIFLLRQFMVGVPNELLEAGKMDGAGSFRCFLHVMLPVSRPVLGAAVALSFADLWNMVEQPLVFLPNMPDAMPLSVVFNQLSESGKSVAFAGATLYILPAVLVYMFFQKDIVSGIQLTELK